MSDEVQVGSRVVWRDLEGRDHDAVVSRAWSPTCVNLVTVDALEQVERFSVSRACAPGDLDRWRLP